MKPTQEKPMVPLPAPGLAPRVPRGRELTRTIDAVDQATEMLGANADPNAIAEKADDLLREFRTVKAVEFGPIVDRSELTDGIVCSYLHTQVRGERRSKLHTYRVGAKLFTLWGTALLDANMRALRPNAYIFIRYDGLRDGEVSGQTEHKWTVKELTNASNERRNAIDARFASAIAVFADAIERARLANRERVPELTDDDFPG